MIASAAAEPRPPGVASRRGSWFCAAVLAVCPSLGMAQAGPSDTLVQALATTAQENFWGRAVLQNGETVQPVDDAERAAPVIPMADSARVVNAAIPVGRAMWCELEWRPYYLKFMQAERRKSWSETQLAFIGVLFGLTQANVSNALIRRGPCPAETRDNVAARIREATTEPREPAVDGR